MDFTSRTRNEKESLYDDGDGICAQKSATSADDSDPIVLFGLLQKWWRGAQVLSAGHSSGPLT